MKESVLSENKGYVKPAEVNAMPTTPGVYLMKSDSGEVIYVGKAKNLKKRVSSYFHKKHADEKTRQLVEHIVLIDYISVPTEAEALFLEANLIKKYSPKYNVYFKDNKFYPFIRVTAGEKFPRIFLARQTPNDGSLYFGPYVSSQSVRRYIDVVQRLFKLRTCRELPKKECLNYHIHRCSAPCIGKVDETTYLAQVDEAVHFLRGEMDELMNKLDAGMRQASKELEFERAQAIKEKIDAIRFFEMSQSVYLASKINADFIETAADMGKAIFVVLIIRQGKLTGKRSYTASLQFEEEMDDVVERFATEYYADSDKTQKKLVIGERFAGVAKTLTKYFEKQGVAATVPETDDEKALMKIAAENATLHLSQVVSKVDVSVSLGELQGALGLDRLPMRIEGFDIANLLGEQAVASMVSFYAAKPDKKNYRHFKIRGKDTPDDFAMMREAVYRRYKRLRDEEESFPDLILVDGGKGQLNAALDALDELGLDLNVASLAKRNEELYRPGISDPVVLPKNSAALHVVQRVRDESHRFANSFYNKLKGKELFRSLLDDIEGIGEKRKQIILDRFIKPGEIETITTEKLIESGIPAEIAEKVYIRVKNWYNKLQ